MFEMLEEFEIVIENLPTIRQYGEKTYQGDPAADYFVAAKYKRETKCKKANQFTVPLGEIKGSKYKQ